MAMVDEIGHGGCKHGARGGGTMCVACAGESVARAMRHERARTLADVVAFVHWLNHTDEGWALWSSLDDDGEAGPLDVMTRAIERGDFERWVEGRDAKGKAR